MLPFDTVWENFSGFWASDLQLRAEKKKEAIALFEEEKIGCLCIQESHVTWQDVPDFQMWANENKLRAYVGFDPAEQQSTSAAYVSRKYGLGQAVIALVAELQAHFG